MSICRVQDQTLFDFESHVFWASVIADWGCGINILPTPYANDPTIGYAAGHLPGYNSHENAK